MKNRKYLSTAVLAGFALALVIGMNMHVTADEADDGILVDPIGEEEYYDPGVEEGYAEYEEVNGDTQGDFNMNIDLEYDDEDDDYDDDFDDDGEIGRVRA